MSKSAKPRGLRLTLEEERKEEAGVRARQRGRERIKERALRLAEEAEISAVKSMEKKK